MIPLLAGWLVKKGVGAAASKRLAIAAFVAIGAPLLFGTIIGGAKLFFWFHDRGVIERHEEKITGQVLEQTLSAERGADTADRQVESRNRARAHALDERMTDAIAAFPVAANGSAGPASQSVLDGLRDEGAPEAPNLRGGAKPAGSQAGDSAGHDPVQLRVDPPLQ